MDHSLINGKGKKQSEVMRERILQNFDNRNEVLKSEEQEKFEERVRKGEVEMITVEEIENERGNRFWKGEDVDEVDKACEQLIEKGEKEELSQDEYDQLVDDQEKMKGLVEKALPVPDGEGGHTYQRVFVEAKNEEGQSET